MFLTPRTSLSMTEILLLKKVVKSHVPRNMHPRRLADTAGPEAQLLTMRMLGEGG